MLTISGKTLGKPKPLFADWTVAPPPGVSEGGLISLRELLTYIVRSEVAAFKERQVLRALSLPESEITENAVRQEVDENEAVATAIGAFENGLYLVVVDEQEQKELDREIPLKPDSRIVFLRLASSAGG
jgi:hypothetical protein